MIGKIFNIPYRKIASTVHGELEHDKRRSSKEKSNKDDEKEKSKDLDPNVPKIELESWIKELNHLECYLKNDLQFTLSFEGQYYLVKLIDKNGHSLQEYLPVQFRALYSQIKLDNDDSKKGTILNLNC